MKMKLIGCLIALALVVGCSFEAPTAPVAATNEHDHVHDHAHPETYVDAVKAIKECRDDVQEAFAAGTPNECDHALHDAVEVLDGLEKLAKSAQLSDDDVKIVKTTAQDLFGHFASIHKGFHGGGEGSSYDDVAKNIDAAIEVLDTKLVAVVHDDEHADHDHDDHAGHDHDEHAGHDHDEHADHDHDEHAGHDHDDQEHAPSGS